MVETDIDFRPAAELIPAIADPRGQYWDQPSLAKIKISASHALISREDFNKLSDYSNSKPTGAYPGKMWRASYDDDDKKLWYLHWFGYHQDPNFVSNHTRIISIQI